jgi:chemotaxis protein CheX
MNSTETQIKLLGQCFVQGLRDVISTMSGVTIAETDSGINDPKGTGEISGLMVLVGEQNILVTISMSADTALALMSYMTGSSARDLPPEELYDGVAELVNMVAGQAKTLATAASCQFKLTSPFTVVGPAHFIVHKNRITTFFKYFTANSLPILLKLYFM